MRQVCTSHELIFDPSYPSLEAYSEYYDYDLLGRPVNFWIRLVRDPVKHLQYFCKTYSWYTSAVIILAVLLLIITFPLVRMCAAVKKWVINSIAIAKNLKAADKIEENRKRHFLPEDLDRHALVLCQAASSRHGIGSVGEWIPADLPDYEAVRFVYQEPWLMEQTHKGLRDKEITPGFEGMLEGELEDALRIAAERSLLKTRRPLPPALMKERKRMLEEAEKPPKASPPPPEKKVYGWEELYKERKDASMEETYRWWMTQRRRLPVEAEEVRDTLGQILGKSRPKSPPPEAEFGENDSVDRNSVEGAREVTQRYKSSKLTVLAPPQYDSDDQMGPNEILVRPRRGGGRRRKSSKRRSKRKQDADAAMDE
ncbi:unnamed protein product [Calicophoron daubneyi]|uniref:Uncharacterized protein n=1 Tax=Calicophoron daubneyi TaxID=300641 RepID=A0AAV2TZ30_CALDB